MPAARLVNLGGSPQTRISEAGLSNMPLPQEGNWVPESAGSPVSGRAQI